MKFLLGRYAQPTKLNVLHAYSKFLSRDNTKDVRLFINSQRTSASTDALMRNDCWNEALVSNPKVVAIYTKNLGNISQMYLEKAKRDNLPVVVLED